jgi:hypothetical protein
MTDLVQWNNGSGCMRKRSLLSEQPSYKCRTFAIHFFAEWFVVGSFLTIILQWFSALYKLKMYHLELGFLCGLSLQGISRKKNGTKFQEYKCFLNAFFCFACFISLDCDLLLQTYVQ